VTAFRIFCVICLAVCCSGPIYSVYADEPSGLDESRRQLEQVEKRLEQAITDLAAKKTTERDLNSDLGSIDQQLRRMQRQVDTARKQLDDLDRDISVAQKDLSRVRSEVEALRQLVQKRLVALYKSEEAGVLKTLFSARNLNQLFEDYDFFSRIVRHDHLLLEEFRTKVRQRQVALDHLAMVRNQHQTLASDLKQREGDLRRTQQIKRRFLAAVRKDRSSLNAMIVDLQENATRLTALVDELTSGAKVPTTTTSISLFALQKGVLPWPVNGPVKVAFGRNQHPELDTLFESHGIEIGAEMSTAVRAVWSGRVAFAKSFKGYGNLMIIDHDDGYYTLYAQVDRLQKASGDAVGKGEVIAYTGFDGVDYLYFEIRQGRTPIDPQPWIEKR